MTLKIVAVAPMLMASVSTAADVKRQSQDANRAAEV
jgi:hypothetical protein